MSTTSQRFKVRATSLGRPDPEDRVRQSMANVHLEGLTPNPKAAKVVRAMADGLLTAEEAINQIRSWYAHRT